GPHARPSRGRARGRGREGQAVSARDILQPVVRGLDPRIHLLCERVLAKAGWTSPAITAAKVTYFTLGAAGGRYAAGVAEGSAMGAAGGCRRPLGGSLPRRGPAGNPAGLFLRAACPGCGAA